MILLDEFSDPSMTNGPDMGIPGIFIFFFVVVLGIGIVGVVVQVTTARRMARRSGLDPDDATAVTLLSPDNGLAATYLASNLAAPTPAAAPPASTPAAPRSTAERLSELDALRAAGSITEEEYAAQRARIVGSV